MIKMTNNKYKINFLFNSLTNKYLFATIKGMRYTKRQFEAEYPDDDACLESVFQNRFGDLKFCPKCAAETNFYRIKKRQAYACQWCAYQLHPLADTIFRKTTTPLKDWFYAIYLFSVSKNGVSAKELERHLGVTYKTAWRMCKQIRLLMAQEESNLSGIVEMDETYMGSSDPTKLKSRNTRKTPVIGAVERGGEVRAETAKDAKAESIIPLVWKYVDVNATLHTDEWRAYRQLARMGYEHKTVRHADKQWKKGNVHTNSIEGFWGQMKRSISGTYHSVSPKYLQHYVDEFVFRYNFRGVAVCPVLLELAAKPV